MHRVMGKFPDRHLYAGKGYPIVVHLGQALAKIDLR